MNVSLFIAKKIIFKNTSQSSIASPIIKIAISAIALGLVMMIIAIGTGRGLENKIQEKIASLNGHIQIFNYDTNRSEVSVTPIELSQDFYPHWEQTFSQEILNQEKKPFDTPLKITHIQPFITKGGIIRTDKTFEGIIAKGVNPHFDFKDFKNYLKQGHLPDFSSEEISQEVLISSYLAKRLQLKVGDKLNTLFLKDENAQVPNIRHFVIAGIYDSGFEQFDSSFILCDIRHLQKINRWSETQVGGFEVFINDFKQMNKASEVIYHNINHDLDSQSLSQKYPTIFEWFHTFNLNIAIIIVIMVIVAGVNMITAILTLVLEKTPTIGLLKSLGATSWQIKKVFLYNAAYLIGKGIIIGNVIGLGILYLQHQFSLIKLDASVYYVEEVAVKITFFQILALNLGVLCLCLLMLLLPLYIIDRVSPVKAMKLD